MIADPCSKLMWPPAVCKNNNTYAPCNPLSDGARWRFSNNIFPEAHVKSTTPSPPLNWGCNTNFQIQLVKKIFVYKINLTSTLIWELVIYNINIFIFYTD